MLPYPPYSLDLSPLDYHRLLRPLEDHMRGQVYKNGESRANLAYIVAKF
jgi:hypothetical protein